MADVVIFVPTQTMAKRVLPKSMAKRVQWSVSYDAAKKEKGEEPTKCFSGT